ncbi:MAG: hypothetical protein ACOH2F_11080 [Cellulomonas sp.]
MVIEEVDERDSTWEDPHPRFRVYIFEGDTPGFNVWTYDITDADALDVIRWAQARAGIANLYAVALVGTMTTPDGEHRGLTWLVGSDANDHDADLDAMRARRDRPAVEPAR